MNILEHLANATTPSMDITEYLAYLGDRITSEILTMLLSSYSALAFANTVRQHSEPVPDIRFDIESNPDASAIPGLIMITSGMVTHCAQLLVPDATRAILGIPEEVEIEVPSTAFSFVLLHEYFHIQRKHNDSQTAMLNDHGPTQRSSDPLTTQQIGRALEYDADLCATGAIYRLTQIRHSKELDDMQIRSVALVVIFWFFLKLRGSHDATNHGALPERMFFIFNKLAQLNANPNIPPDANSTEDSDARGFILAKVAINLEELFSKDNPEYRPGLRDFIVSLSVPEDRKKALSASSSWDKIRGTVGQVSKSVTWRSTDLNRPTYAPKKELMEAV